MQLRGKVEFDTITVRGMGVIYRNHYQMLGISSLSDSSQIKSAFRRLSMVHHPDKNKNSEESNQLYKLILNAYKILSDSIKRKEYDDFLNRSRYIKNFGRSSRLSLDSRFNFNSRDILGQINLTLWEIDEILSGGKADKFRKYILIILTFLDKWVLEPGGFPDYFMEARNLERTDPREYIRILDADLPVKGHLPYNSAGDYYRDIRKRADKFITRYEQKAEPDYNSASESSFVDGIIEYHNMAIHYLSYMLTSPADDETIIREYEFSSEKYNYDYKL